MEIKPLVSVVIPVYNQLPTLLRAVQSVLNQSYLHFEVIVVDDGSDIEIEDELHGLCDERIFFYRNPEHQNANVARNLGIEKARGSYVAMLDSDDEWMDDHLHDCLGLLQQSGADGLYGSLMVKSSDRQQLITARIVDKNEKIINYLLSHGYGAQTSTLFATAESMRNVGWDPALGRHQDYDFVVRFASAYRFTVKEKPTVIYHLTMKHYRIDYHSCIRFIRQNRRDIRPLLYNHYHQSMHKMLESKGYDREIIEHYRKESVRYVYFYSYRDYLNLLKPSTCWERWRYKLIYLYQILLYKTSDRSS